MNCTYCQAETQEESGICLFCQSITDPFSAQYRVACQEGEKQRNCSICENVLYRIDLGLHGQFIINRCPTCRGHFFDHAALSKLILEPTPSDDSNSHLLELLEYEPPVAAEESGFRSCPTCRRLMNREQYGEGKGLLEVDLCPMHGLWIAGGEISKLLSWVQQLSSLSGIPYRIEGVVEESPDGSLPKPRVYCEHEQRHLSYQELAEDSRFRSELDRLLSEALARIFSALL